MQIRGPNAINFDGGSLRNFDGGILGINSAGRGAVFQMFFRPIWFKTIFADETIHARLSMFLLRIVPPNGTSAKHAGGPF